MISGPWSTNFALAPSRCTAAKTLCVSMIYPLYSFEIILQPGVAYVAQYLAAIASSGVGSESKSPSWAKGLACQLVN